MTRPRFAALGAAAAAAALAAALSACGGSSTAAHVAETSEVMDGLAAADPALGAEVFADTCSVCHGDQGQGSVGASLVGVADRLTEQQHVTVVIAGRGAMPPFGSLLTPEELSAVVAYQRRSLS